MLLTLTTTHRPGTDLGHLLVKHPDRVQSFELPAGTAHVLYPEADEQRCTAALLVEIDPLRLGGGRGRRQAAAPDSFTLGQYVNDRPYAASSLLSSALAKVFRSALRGESRGGRSWPPLRYRWRCASRCCAAGAAPSWPYGSSPRSAGR